MHHVVKIRHAELNLLVQYRILDSIHVILANRVVMNLQFVCAQIQHSLHRIVAVTNHKSIDYSSHFLQNL